MERIMINIEFKMPDIPKNLTSQEIVEINQERILYPSRVVQAVMERLMIDGIEIISSQIHRSGKKDIKVPDIRH